jgi:hypothetical protein
MSDSDQNNNSNPLLSVPVLVAIITGVFGVILAIITLLSRDTPAPLVEITAQAIQTAAASTAIAQQTSLASVITLTPTYTSLPTETPQPIATFTLTPDPLPTTTLVVVDTETPTLQSIDILIPTNTLTNTISPISLPNCDSIPSLPCVVKIPGEVGSIAQVHVTYSRKAPLRPAVARGSTVTVQRCYSELGITWYEIQYESNSGWIESRYIELNSSCP